MLPEGRAAGPIDGRLLLFVSTLPVNSASEPRFQVGDQDAFRSTGPRRSTVEQESRMELAFGTRSRSGGPWDAWEAVFSPKIHVAVGLSDNFFLNDAVYRAEEFLATARPPADAEFLYGAMMADWWARTAPPGADVTGWR